MGARLRLGVAPFSQRNRSLRLIQSQRFAGDPYTAPTVPRTCRGTHLLPEGRKHPPRPCSECAVCRVQQNRSRAPFLPETVGDVPDTRVTSALQALLCAFPARRAVPGAGVASVSDVLRLVLGVPLLTNSVWKFIECLDG